MFIANRRPDYRQGSNEKGRLERAGLRGYLWGIEPYSEHIDPASSDLGGLGG